MNPNEIKLDVTGPDEHGYFTCNLWRCGGVITERSYNEDRAQAYALQTYAQQLIDGSRTFATMDATYRAATVKP